MTTAKDVEKMTESEWKALDRRMDKKFGLNKKGQPIKKKG